MLFRSSFFFLPITNFFRSALFLFCIECLAESIEKKVKKFLSVKKYMGKVQGIDVSSRVEKVDARSGDQENAKKKKGKLVNHFFFVVVVLASFGNVLVVYLQCILVFFVGEGVMPLLSNIMVAKSAAKIGSLMLGLDGSIENMENAKQILSKMQKLEGKMDAKFQRIDHKIEEEFRRLELLIKSRCEGSGPRPQQSGSGGDSGIDEDSNSNDGFEIGVFFFFFFFKSFFFFFELMMILIKEFFSK